MAVLLFDIDGTLVSAMGAGRLALQKSVLNNFNIDDDLSGIEFAGQTDTAIISRVIARISEQKSSMPANAEEKLLSGYLFELEALLNQKPAQVLPGTEEILATVARNDSHIVGLLTGNVREGAKLKLSFLFEQFEFGFFGDISHDRNDISRAALEHLKASHDIKASDIIIIGDTPKDIECARAIKARSVAVATGPYKLNQLTGADHAFEELTHALKFFEDLT